MFKFFVPWSFCLCWRVSVWLEECFQVCHTSYSDYSWVGLAYFSQTSELTMILGGLFWAVFFPNSIKLLAVLLFCLNHRETILITAFHQKLYYVWQCPYAWSSLVSVPNKVVSSGRAKGLLVLWSAFPLGKQGCWEHILISPRVIDAFALSVDTGGKRLAAPGILNKPLPELNLCFMSKLKLEHLDNHYSWPVAPTVQLPLKGWGWVEMIAFVNELGVGKGDKKPE